MESKGAIPERKPELLLAIIGEDDWLEGKNGFRAAARPSLPAAEKRTFFRPHFSLSLKRKTVSSRQKENTFTAVRSCTFDWHFELIKRKVLTN